MIGRALIAIVMATLLQACAYTGHVESVSGAAEVMPTRHIDADADVRISPDITEASTKINIGFVCSAHDYSINAGPAIAESILKTMDAAFNNVTRVESQQERENAYFLDFTLDEFSPRLKFNPGFWSATPEGNTELSIRVRAVKPDGTLAIQTTARGQGRYDDGAGGCGDGMPVVEQATRVAIQRAMEDLVQKLINSKVLVED